VRESQARAPYGWITVDLKCADDVQVGMKVYIRDIETLEWGWEFTTEGDIVAYHDYIYGLWSAGAIFAKPIEIPEGWELIPEHELIQGGSRIRIYVPGGWIECEALDDAHREHGPEAIAAIRPIAKEPVKEVEAEAGYELVPADHPDGPVPPEWWFWDTKSLNPFWHKSSNPLVMIQPAIKNGYVLARPIPTPASEPGARYPKFEGYEFVCAANESLPDGTLYALGVDGTAKTLVLYDGWSSEVATGYMLAQGPLYRRIEPPVCPECKRPLEADKAGEQ
jgi:hypothetical protein